MTSDELRSLIADGLTGRVKVNSVSGEIVIRDHAGVIGLNTVSGDVIVSGAITRFDADSVSGQVRLDATGVPDAVRVNTVSGAVTARFDPDAAANYTINTVGGRLQLDNISISTRGGYTGRHGDLDKSWTDVRIYTVGGDINVLHSVRS